MILNLIVLLRNNFSPSNSFQMIFPHIFLVNHGEYVPIILRKERSPHVKQCLSILCKHGFSNQQREARKSILGESMWEQEDLSSERSHLNRSFLTFTSRLEVHKHLQSASVDQLGSIYYRFNYQSHLYYHYCSCLC